LSLDTKLYPEKTMKAKQINRRNFLAKSSMGILGAGASTGYIRGMSHGDDLTARIGEEYKIMEYRILGRTGFKVSDIGCGPVSISNENLMKAILNRGVNFIDTAEGYGNGNNERMVGRAIKGFDRKSIFVNTKIHISENDTKETIVSRVRKCLERLDTDYLDGVMLWNVSSIKEIGNEVFHQAIDQLKNEGRVKCCGVSSHGATWDGKTKDSMAQVIGAAVEDGRFDLVLFVYNYVQQEMGKEILKACTKKNIGTTLMKTDPFGGYAMGVLEMVKNYENDTVPPYLQTLYNRVIEKQMNAESFIEEHQLHDEKAKREAAIGFVLNDPAVHSALISFKNFNDIDNYTRLSGKRLTAENKIMIKSLQETLGHLYCRHACGMCENQCPHGVPINTIMRYNHYLMAQGREKYAIEKYYALPGSKPDVCSECEGFCELSCPYGVSIRSLLSMAHQNLSLNSIT